jgi:ligand-binding sensor domain-containing protein
MIAGISGKGLLKWRENTWEYISPINSLFGDTIRNLLATSDGKLWVDSFSDFPISTDDAKLMAFDSHSLIGPPLISQENWGISRIIEGPKNSIIILTQKVGYPIYFNQALIFKDNELSNLFDPPLSKEYFNSVAVGFDQEIWLTSNKRLYLFENDKWKTYQTPWSKEPGSPEVVTSMVDKNGVVWFGLSFNPLMGTITDEKCGIRLDNGPEFGVYSFDGKKWRNFTTKDGLVDNKICTIAVSPDGSVWFGSFDKGLSRFDGKTWTTYSIK